MTVTFKVDDVERPNSAYSDNGYKEPENPFGKSIKMDTWNEANALRQGMEHGMGSLGVKNVEAFQMTGINRRYTNPQENGFLKTVYHAYNNHIPLTLSPDDIWLVVLQAITKHIELNPEDARKAIVNFEGKKTLTILRNHFVKGSPNNDWAGGFAGYSEQIGGYIGKKRDLFDPTFTTSTPITKAANQVQMMAALAPYFDYRCMTCCGIPNLTLLGSTEDWASILQRVNGFREFYPAWAADPLGAAIGEFVAASAGRPNMAFWQSFFKDQSMGSGGSPITGYVNVFFPYVTTTKYTKETGSQAVTEPNRMLKDGKMADGSTGYELGDYGSSVAAVPLVWDYYGTEIKMKIAAGCFGYWIEDNENVRPVLGWTVGEDANG